MIVSQSNNLRRDSHALLCNACRVIPNPLCSWIFCAIYSVKLAITPVYAPYFPTTTRRKSRIDRPNSLFELAHVLENLGSVFNKSERNIKPSPSAWVEQRLMIQVCCTFNCLAGYHTPRRGILTFRPWWWTGGDVDLLMNASQNSQQQHSWTGF